MKFVLAPDKFKGSLNGKEFCDAVEKGIRKVFPDAIVIKKPLADGGDGTLEVIRDYLSAKMYSRTVHDPLFRKVEAPYLYSKEKRIAFIEMSEASGHRLLKPEELNCMETTTLGTGELILDAIKKGAKEILLGIGGSATNDGGMGVAQALGFTFLDKNGHPLSPIGKNLERVETITPPNGPKTKGIQFKIACDVTNPFYGPNGAAHVYAAQKGASIDQIEILDNGLKHFAGIVEKTFGINLQGNQGAGAAGGLGGGAIVFLNSELLSGIQLVKEIADFDNSLKDADWIITGEGKLDNQTLSGKTIAGVLESGKKYQIPVAAFCGIVELTTTEQQQLGITFSQSILKGFQSLDEAMRSSYENLAFAAFNFANAIMPNKHPSPR